MCAEAQVSHALRAERAVKDFGRAPGWNDLAIDELPDGLRQALNAPEAPFLNSLDYCTTYDFPPARRVAVQIDERQAVISAVYYRERRWLGILRVVEVVGFPRFSASDLERIASSRNAHVLTVLRMHAPGDCESLPRGWSSIERTYDVIAELPPAKEGYLQALGTQKRQQLPRYWRRLQREYGNDVAMVHQSGGEINLDDILTLVRFNQTRMQVKGKANATIEETTRQQRRWPLTQKSGLLCTMVAQGRTIGGTFNYLHGDEAFLIVPAHDPALEHLNVGNVCLWKTFEHLIDRGIKRYHLFWGRKPYKNQFLGVDHRVTMTIHARPRLWLPLARMIVALDVQGPRAWRFIRSRLFKTRKNEPQLNVDERR